MKTKTRLALLLSVFLLSSFGVTSIKADTLIASFDVSSDGTPVDSPILNSGTSYRIVAREIYCVSNTESPRVYADAMYYSSDTQPGGWIWNSYETLPDGHSFLQINGMDVDWGSYYSDHRYEIEYIGEGTAITFQIYDWIDEDYSNNYCHLEIYELPRSFGLTPGFRKNHVDAWVGYEESDLVCSVFTEAVDFVDCDDTLLDALRYHGGKGPEGGARILLRAATAAILNAEHPEVNYPMTTDSIVDAVNAALDSGVRSDMLDLATQLDNYNNLGSPWD